MGKAALGADSPGSSAHPSLLLHGGAPAGSPHHPGPQRQASMLRLGFVLLFYSNQPLANSFKGCLCQLGIDGPRHRLFIILFWPGCCRKCRQVCKFGSPTHCRRVTKEKRGQLRVFTGCKSLLEQFPGAQKGRADFQLDSFAPLRQKTPGLKGCRKGFQQLWVTSSPPRPFS